MRNHRSGVGILTLAVAGFALASARAQAPSTGTVTGTGTVELKRQAEFLRLQVEVQAKGKTLKEALAKLREKREAAQKSLEALGVVPGSIEFGEPTIVEEKDDRQRQVAMRMMRQMRNQGVKPPQKPKEATPILVSVSLKAEFRLKPSEPEEFLIVANALEQRMKAADLGGLKDLKQASPQDEELAQEEAEEMMGFSEQNAPKRGEPIFLYISKISEDDRQKALAQAYKKAKQEAAQLAQAAGVELGSLHHLQDTAATGSSMEDNDFMNQYNFRLRRYFDYAQANGTGDESQPGEAMGLKPKKVSYRIVVSATFELKKPAK